MVGTLAISSAAVAQTYPLTETSQAGDCYRYCLEMKLTGEMRVTKNGMVTPMPLSASATHEFPERILAVVAPGLPQKAARVYETARALIKAGDSPSERTLRPERRLLVAQRQKDQLLVYHPSGPLTRRELELTSEHFDTLAVTGLLPGKAVAVGDTWKVPNAVVQALCAVEGMTEQDLTCKLEEVKDNVARVSVMGTINGIELGACVKLTVEANYSFDLSQKRLAALEWKQKDERDQGPASPAATTEATTTLTRTPIEQPMSLSDVALVSVPEGNEVPSGMLLLSHADPKSRFEVSYEREWQVVAQTEDHLVMRLMDRGDFVAQVTVTPWTKAEAGQHLSPDEFRQAMTQTPGWEPEEEVQAGEIPQEGAWVYRLSSAGKLDGLKVTQNFYLVAGPGGDQVVLTFTMTPAQVQKLGTRDLSMIASVAFPSKK
jgi:hypothetical protein